MSVAAFERFSGRVGRDRAVILSGRVSCRRCREIFSVDVYAAASASLTPPAILEAASTVCARCATKEAELRAREGTK